jgi:hypothetical protein
MATQTGRPPKSGVNAESRNAERFRREFRKWRDHCGATNRDVGIALEKHGLCGTSDGMVCVQNALTPSRKLTHEWARRLVAGLLLSAPARRPDPMCDEAPLVLLPLLVAMGAVRIAPPPPPAIFIPYSEIASFVAYIDREAAEEQLLGPKMRACLTKAMTVWLQNAAPRMALAWVNATHKTLGGKFSNERRLLDRIAGKAFGINYFDTFGVEWEPELEVLLSERPELMSHYAALLFTSKEKP